MDPKKQPQFNPNTPISEVLKQEQTGYAPTATPKATLNDVVSAMNSKYNDVNQFNATTPAFENVPKGHLPSEKIISETSNAVKIIKTYKSDAAEAVRTQQSSVARIAMEQESRRRAEGEEIGAAPKKRHIGLLLMVIMLIGLGAVAIPTVNYFLNQKSAEVPIAIQKTIISSDHQSVLNLNSATRNEFVSVLNEFKIKNQLSPTIEYVKILENIRDPNNNPATQLVSASVFAGLIGPNMPSALARSFDSTYMFGFSNSKAFVLLKTSSYEQTFANMLRWENKMTDDLTTIFTLGTNVDNQSFVDRVVINKDIRAITALDGTIIFMYGFLDNQTLMITTDPKIFQDINNSYVASRFVQ